MVETPTMPVRAAATSLSLAAVLLAGPTCARAAEGSRPVSENRPPSFLGATGLLLTPNAYVQRDGEISVFGAAAREFAGGGFLIGLRNRLEAGVAVLDGHGDFTADHTRVIANAKLSLLDETLTRPGVSVGVQDAFDQLGRGPGWYLVTSK